jgi:hypothetical protein
MKGPLDPGSALQYTPQYSELSLFQLLSKQSSQANSEINETQFDGKDNNNQGHRCAGKVLTTN